MPESHRKDIIARCRNVRDEMLRGCPFAGYNVILESIVEFYDDALWKFRKPVRDIEKVSARKYQDEEAC